MASAVDVSDLSSELSSPPASPVPPPSFFCPSPPPSQESSLSSSQSTAASPLDHTATTSKRKPRKTEPKPRTTRYLDLAAGDQSAEDLMLKTLRKKRKIVVVAGAGISVSAGIPDFRSSHGLFSTLRKDHKLKTSGKKLFDISVYQDESTTSSFHDMVRDLSSKANKAEPTGFHHLLARLAKEKRLRRLYTQNVDEIDTSLPPLVTQVPLNHKAPWPYTIQLHGGLKTMVCQKCRHTSDLQADRFEGPCPPLCGKCHENDTLRTAGGQRSHGVGKLRPRIVLYNEQSPDEDAIGSVMTADLRARPDALIVVGTTMKIPGVRRIVREMCRVVRGRRDGVTMWINSDSMPAGKEFENCWDLIIKGDSNDVARRVGLKKWDDKSDETSATNHNIVSCTEAEVERYKENQPSVVISTSVKAEAHPDSGILTPSANHDETTVGSSICEEPIESKPLENPASKDRQMTDVLGHDTNKLPPTKSKARKSRAPRSTTQKKKGETATLDQTEKINKKFRVGKSGNSGTSKSGKSVAVKEEELSKPMCPVSLGSPRSNGPILPSPPEDPETPPQPPLWKAKCTISPPGGLPRGLEGFIETGTENNQVYS